MTSRRTTPLPPDWPRIRMRILKRDGHRCTLIVNGERCPRNLGLEVDHIGDPDDHSDANLRTLCHRHHAARTGRQAARARWGTRTAQRATPQHPGRIDTDGGG